MVRLFDFFTLKLFHIFTLSLYNLSWMKKVYLETFGCQMNVSDSERVATSLAANGFEMTREQDAADVILINTCSVREKAEQKLYTEVGHIRKSFAKKPVVGVMGCVAQLEGETLFNKIEGIDLILGTKAVGRATDAIARVLEGEREVVDLGEEHPRRIVTKRDRRRPPGSSGPSGAAPPV